MATLGDMQSAETERDSLMFLMTEKQLGKLEQHRRPNINMLHFISEAVYSAPEVYGNLRERAVALYERLGDKKKKSVKGLEISRFLNPLPEVKAGDRMADATLPDLDGNMHTLSDYLGKDKYLLLDFWASWCGPCLEFIPVYKALHEEYADEMTIIGINMDSNLAAWERSSTKHGITWLDLHASESDELTIRYRITSYPRAVLIDPNGTVLAIDHPESIVDREYSQKILKK